LFFSDVWLSIFKRQALPDISIKQQTTLSIYCVRLFRMI